MKKMIFVLAAALTTTAMAQADTFTGDQSQFMTQFAKPVDPNRPWDRPGADFAKVEDDWTLREGPLHDRLKMLTADILADKTKWSEEGLEQLYARLESGPIPESLDGKPGVAYMGKVIITPESGMGRVDQIAASLARQHKATQLLLSAANAAGLSVEGFAMQLWQGKVFYKQEGWLRNLISSKYLDAIKAFVVATKAPAAKSFNVHTDDNSGAEYGHPLHRLFFPAKLYCGQSMIDSRRESIIIDYTYSEDSPYYQEGFDRLAGRNGLQIRDEIRMVHPGLYLGRAYSAGAYLLTFVLENKEVEAKFQKDGTWPKSDCWEGTQQVSQHSRDMMAKISGVSAPTFKDKVKSLFHWN